MWLPFILSRARNSPEALEFNKAKQSTLDVATAMATTSVSSSSFTTSTRTKQVMSTPAMNCCSTFDN